MPIAERHYPILLGEQGELDVIEVDNTIRNSWLALYSLQEDVTIMQDKVAGAIRRGEIAENDTAASVGKVKEATLVTVAPTTGVKLVNATSGVLPYINTALQLDTINAPFYDFTTGAFTNPGVITGQTNLVIVGDSNLQGDVDIGGTLSVVGAVDFAATLIVTGAVDFLSTLDVTGATTLLSTLGVTGLITSDGGIVIDADLAEALLVRADGDSGDVFAVNTVTGVVAVTGDVTVSGTYTGQGAMLLDVDAAEAFLVRQDGDAGDVFGINTLTSVITVTGSVTISDTLDVVNDVTISSGDVTLDPEDTGNDIPGKKTSVGNNTNVGAEGGAPGVVELFSADGTPCYLWCKNDGSLAIGPAQPTGSTGSPTVPSEIGGVVVSTPSIKSYSFASPPGGPGTFFVGGFYFFDTDDANLDQGPPPSNTNVSFGTANVAYGAHAAIVAGGAGTASGGAGTVEIEVSGTSITDAGVRTVSDTEILVADITTLVLDQYVETAKKWIGEITFTLQNSSGSTHTTFAVDFNYGLSRYEDFGGNNFNIDIFDFAGIAGANDTIFNVELLHHQDADWTYAATGFVPGGTVLVDFAADYSTESELSNTEPYSFQRTDIDTLINVDNLEGLIIRITTGSNNSVAEMDLHLSGLFT